MNIIGMFKFGSSGVQSRAYLISSNKHWVAINARSLLKASVTNIINAGSQINAWVKAAVLVTGWEDAKKEILHCEV